MAAEEVGISTLGSVTTQSPGLCPEREARSGLVPVLTILCHPRLERIGERCTLGELRFRDAIGVSRLEPGFSPPGAAGGAPLGDTHLSRAPLRLIALPGGQIRLDASASRTPVVVEGEPLEGRRDVSAEEVARGVILQLAARIVLLLHVADSSPPEPGDDLGLVGASHLLEQVRRDIRRIADLAVPVLVRGETGTGKELVARAIHAAGADRARPFIAVNMAAIPPSLAAAEIFGAERGAYTGAVRSQPGYFGLAQEGTLFLDEIGEAPLDVQVMLLRALETGEIQAVGAQQPRRARVRVIAATDADLEAKIADGSFRAPLLHRLAGYEIALPSLRERRDDIGRLTLHILRAELAQLGDPRALDRSGPIDPLNDRPWLPASLMARLVRYDWPGNVRQLRNVIRQLVVGSRGAACLEGGPALERLLGRATLDDRRGEDRRRGRAGGATAAEPQRPESADEEDHSSDPGRSDGPGWRKPSEVPEEELIDALRRSRWDLKATAGLLRVSRTSLYALMENCHRVRRAGDLRPEEIARCYRECDGDIEEMVNRLEVSKRALLRRIRELRIG